MITQFAMRLICGMSAVWCVMPRKQVTSGFFRIQMLVTLGLSVLAAVAAGELASPVISAQAGDSAVLPAGSIRVLMAISALLSFVGSVFWTLERRVGGGRIGYLIAVISTACVALNGVSSDGFSTLRGNLYWLAEIATGLVSGAVVGGMLLGHWYLTAPTMSTSPLNKINAWLAISAALRLLLAAVALVSYWPVVFQGQLPALASDRESGPGVTFSSIHSIWLSLEWLGEVIGPFAVCLMVHRIMKYRNTQSATGVLFVGVILAFLGEMSAALLRRELQLPF